MLEFHSLMSTSFSGACASSAGAFASMVDVVCWERIFLRWCWGMTSTGFRASCWFPACAKEPSLLYVGLDRVRGFKYYLFRNEVVCNHYSKQKQVKQESKFEAPDNKTRLQ